MYRTAQTAVRRRSLPSRERGLKCRREYAHHSNRKVAPFAGAWIEIGEKYYTLTIRSVAPFAGAWIEIISALTDAGMLVVAPFTGAWIEISSEHSRLCVSRGRSLHGSVD